MPCTSLAGRVEMSPPFLLYRIAMLFRGRRAIVHFVGGSKNVASAIF